MGLGDSLVIGMSKILGGWNFLAIHSMRLSRGLIIGNYFSSPSIPFTILQMKSLGIFITLLNLYVPYNGKQLFWDNLLNMQCIKLANLVI